MSTELIVRDRPEIKAIGRELPRDGRTASRAWTFARVIAVLLCVSACGDGLLGKPSDVVISEVTAPAAQHVATVFIRQGNATSADATIVCIRRGAQPFEEEVIQAGRVLTVKYKQIVSAQWLAERKLLIVLPQGCVTFRRLDKWNDVAIEYREEGRTQ